MNFSGDDLTLSLFFVGAPHGPRPMPMSTLGPTGPSARYRMSARQQRRAGLARERAAGTRRKPCPWCGRLLVMTTATGDVKHEAPACKKFGEAVLKAGRLSHPEATTASGPEDA